jgi:hypothetical protein
MHLSVQVRLEYIYKPAKMERTNASEGKAKGITDRPPPGGDVADQKPEREAATESQTQS